MKLEVGLEPISFFASEKRRKNTGNKVRKQVNCS